MANDGARSKVIKMLFIHFLLLLPLRLRFLCLVLVLFYGLVFGVHSSLAIIWRRSTLIVNWLSVF